MRVELKNVTTSNDYAEATTLRLVSAVRVMLQTANAAVYYQLDESPDGKGDWTNERFLSPSSGSFSRRCSGLRIRSAVAGAPAQVSAELLDAIDVGDGADSFAPFSGHVTPAGAVGVTLSLVTGDYFESAVGGARDGAVLCDGTRYNSITDPTFENLYNKIGITYGGTGPADFAVPDRRGRVSVMVGTHADVDAVTDNDGLAVGSRTPKHRHTVTVTDPGHTHDIERVENNSSGGNAGISGVEPNGANVISNALAKALLRVTGITVAVGPAGTPLDGPAFQSVYVFIVK